MMMSNIAKIFTKLYWSEAVFIYFYRR